MENLVITLENMAVEHGKLLIELKFQADRIKEITAKLNNIKTPFELYAVVTKNVELPSSEICLVSYL